MDRSFGVCVRAQQAAPARALVGCALPKATLASLTSGRLLLASPPSSHAAAAPSLPLHLEPKSHSTAAAARCQSMAVSVRSFPVIP
jgi:hypothetical protein